MFYKNLYNQEAAERKKATQAKQGKIPVVENLPPPEKGKSRDKAGEA